MTAFMLTSSFVHEMRRLDPAVRSDTGASPVGDYQATLEEIVKRLYQATLEEIVKRLGFTPRRQTGGLDDPLQKVGRLVL
jgi:hypothetical protein